MTNPKSKKRLTPEILLRIYNVMKENPNKYFQIKDFMLNGHTERIYFDTLIKLGLIKGSKDYKQKKIYIWRNK